MAFLEVNHSEIIHVFLPKALETYLYNLTTSKELLNPKQRVREKNKKPRVGRQDLGYFLASPGFSSNNYDEFMRDVN